jgi:hypothetical protein
MHSPENLAQAIKYEKRRGKSSPKEDRKTGMNALPGAVVPVLERCVKIRFWYTFPVATWFSPSDPSGGV